MKNNEKMKNVGVKITFVALVTLLAWFNVAAAVIAICATLLTVLYGRAASIIEFSFGPLKAKIDRELSDAERLVDQLRKLATIQARQAISASARIGRFSSEDDWIFVATKRTESALREIGVSEEIREARSDLIDLAIFDLGHAATGGPKIPLKLGSQAISEWKEARKNKLFADPDQVERWLTKWDMLNSQRQLRIDAMRWMLEHRDIRDSQQYMLAQHAVNWDEQ